MKKRIKNILGFLIPFALWGLLFFPLLSTQVPVSSETLHIYSVVKFYIDNLKLGVFPMWDPFVMWGAPTQIFLNYAGVFNPLWLLMIVLGAIGIGPYSSFLILIVLYFWLGLWGFYLLAKLLLNDKTSARLAFLLLVFSSISMSMFSQYHTPLIYIPSVWFFYFFISFIKNPSRKALAGLTFSLALILTSYLPFYFITVFILFFLSTIILYHNRVGGARKKILVFIKKNILLTILSCFVLVLAALPGYFAYESTARQEVVAPFRNENVGEGAGVRFDDYSKASKNGFSSRMDLEDLYSYLDLIHYGDDGFFYMSVFFYVILVLGGLTKITRLTLSCAFIAVVLFLLMMATATGFHRFVFEHVAYFKLIRNMHFFLPFFMGVVVVLAAEQFRVLAEMIKNFTKENRSRFIIFVLCVHVGAFVFLFSRSGIIFSSFIALILSAVFWILLARCRKDQDKIIAFFVLFFAIVVQPVEVIWKHNQSARQDPQLKSEVIKESVAAPSARPVFKYTRPVSDRVIGNDDTASSRILMRDASRFFQNGFPTYWSYELAKTADFSEIQKLTTHKFYISGEQVDGIKNASDRFRVLEFTVNSVRVYANFKEQKTLIYTDSYHKAWKAFINGRPAHIERTAKAFKGIDLPAGENIVEFKYSPSGLAAISLLLSLLLCGNLIYLLGIRS